MSRRTALFATLLAAALAAALVPWTVTSERVKAAVARQIGSEYGLRLVVGGPASVSLLPVPRVKLADVTLSDEAGTVVARAERMKAELRLAPLLLGRLRIAEVRVANALIDVALDGSPDEVWTASLDRLRRRLAADTSGSHVERLVVTGSQLRLSHAALGAPVEWRKVDAVLRWPQPTGDVLFTSTAEWRGETVQLSVGGLNPSRLLAGERDAVDVKLSTRLGRLNGVGDVTWGTSPRFDGLLAGQTSSFGALALWTGIGLDLQDLDRPVVVSGEGSLGRSGVEWPRLALDIGRDRLEGTVSYRLDTARPQLRATLAGEDLDLDWALPIAEARRMERPGADYDVRLSALRVRMGPLRLRDVAAGILVSGERLDLSVARATLAGGSARGRLSAGLDGEGRDVRGQVSLDGVDLEKLLAETGAVRGITGTLSGQASFEVQGERHPDLARHMKGRMTLTARDGEIVGIALGDLSRRPEPRPTAGLGPPDWRGGRTRFGHAAVTLGLSDGVAEITEGTIGTAATRTRLRGNVSLPDGILAVQTTTWPTSQAETPDARPTLVLDVQGPLERPTVTASEPAGRR